MVLEVQHLGQAKEGVIVGKCGQSRCSPTIARTDLKFAVLYHALQILFYKVFAQTNGS